MMKRSLLGLVLTVALLPLSACGGAAIGEECDEQGAEGECEDGGVCGKEKDDSDVPICLKVCKEQEDCAADEDCNGVEGTNIKGCRPAK